MNPTLLQLLEKNASDIEAIVTAVGVPTLAKIFPNILAILQTLQAAQKS